VRLQLESTRDVINLDDIATKGTGVQALRGTQGLGLPPVDVQWLEGAGDGASFRGQRVKPRDIDLPLHIVARDRTHLKELLSRLAVMLAGPVTLRLIEADGSDWSTTVRRVGGGTYAYGVDTIGETDFSTVITLRAGDPFFTYSRTTRRTIENTGGGRGLLRGLAKLRISASQAIGTITLENLGDATAYPVWDIHGPGRDFKAVATTGERLHWTGLLGRDDTLRIDTRAGTVVDGTGASRYAELAPAPRFWTIPPGTTVATASLEDTSPGTPVPGQPRGVVRGRSSISCTWRPRKWMVI
jgi:hypothetical protein